jgi:Ca-activated chloride channel family protein
VFHVAADALGAPMKAVQKITLRQDAPGSYTAEFKPDQAGVYLIRAQSGAEMVTRVSFTILRPNPASAR